MVWNSFWKQKCINAPLENSLTHCDRAETYPNRQLVLINVLYKTQKKRPSHSTVLSIFSKMIFPGLLTHCTYLAIYISQKIRLFVVDFEGQFQTSLQAESINFLISKFKSIILIFLLFFACFCVKSQLQYCNSLEQQWQCAKSSGFDNSCKK